MCSKGAAFGNKCCLDCLRKGRERSAKRYENTKKEKKCKTCGKCVLDNSILCQDCKDEKKTVLKKRKEDGICVTCASKKATKGIKCEECYLSYKRGTKVNKELRLANGCCAYCDEKRVSGGSTQLCEKHFLQFMSRTHLGSVRYSKDLESIFKSQKGKCPYTGYQLILGVNASIDHIFPKCLGGSKGIDNLQWVYGPANFMKADQIEEDFLKLVKDIYENRNLGNQ